MLQNLACTRRAVATLAFWSPLNPYVSRRFYATSKNKDIINLLKECWKKERSSPIGNRYKARSFNMAVPIIEKLDFRIRHIDDLKDVRGIHSIVRSRINVFLGHEEGRPPIPLTPDAIQRHLAMKTLKTIPGVGDTIATELYDAGCDTTSRLRLARYHQTLGPGVKRGLKYVKHFQHPLPRQEVETIVDFCKLFIPMGGSEVLIAGEYRRGELALSFPLELLFIDKNSTDPLLTPPHPSTLKPPGPTKPRRTKLPFWQPRAHIRLWESSTMFNKIIKPLESLGVVSDTTRPGVNVWQGWVRLPKKNGPWESRRDRLDGIQKVDGTFRRANITYVHEKSRGTALLAVTGDEDFYLECKRKAIQAGLYLNEWGLWEWEPDPKSISRFQTSDAPHEKTSLGAIWGSETEADVGRWVQLETFNEEQIFDAIGMEYVPPEKRNLRFILGKTRAKRKPTVNP